MLFAAGLLIEQQMPLCMWQSVRLIWFRVQGFRVLGFRVSGFIGFGGLEGL